METKQKGLKSTLSNNIRQLRLHLKMSQEEMGRILGLKRSSYGKIERGECYPSIRALYFLAAKYNVSLDYLVCGRGTLFSEKKLTGQKSETGNTQTFVNEEDELIYLMKQVPLVHHSIMSYFQRFKFENRDLIQVALKNKGSGK